MNNKKKQTAAVAMAAVLSVSTVVNPITVRAQENEPPVTQGIAQDNVNGKKETGKETAPAIALPENLQATEGTPLKEIALPENWTWADESTILSADVTEYPAYVTVDDETYDYAVVEGYHAEGHYVEVRLSVAVELPEEERAELQGEIPVEPPIIESSLLKRAVPVPYAIGDVEINEKNFPDEGFRVWLMEQKYGKDGIITQEEMENITAINVRYNESISSLTGIEKFSNLAELDCFLTNITSLDVSKNVNLTKLWCGRTGIESLDISNNTNLTELYCNSPGITSLDVSNNVNLTKLACDGTGITSLDVSQNVNLTDLWCDNTSIISLDVSSNDNLELLYCSNTPLAYLNLGTEAGLITLDMPDTTTISREVTEDTFNIADKISGIDKSKVSNVSGADYDPATGVVSNYTAGTPIVYTYDCGTANDVKKTLTVTLKITGYSAAIEINESNFPDAEFRKWLENQSYGADGKITQGEIAGITSIDVGSQSLIKDFTGIEFFTALASFSCINAECGSLDLSKNTALTYLDCTNTSIRSLDVSQNTILTTLKCTAVGIASLDVSRNTALETLDCSMTQIKSLDVSQNTALKDLNCYNTKINGLDVSQNIALEKLSCTETPLAYLNIGNNTALNDICIPDSSEISLGVKGDRFNIKEAFPGIDPEKVKVNSGASYDKDTGVLSGYSVDNPIQYSYDCGRDITLNVTLKVFKKSIEINETNFPDAGFRAWLKSQSYGADDTITQGEIAGITEIRVSGNEQIKDLTGIEYFTALATLDCSGTGISSLDVSQNTALTNLHCFSTGISNLDVSKNTALTDLYCYSTGISSLDVSQNTALTDLFCSDTGISSLDVSKNTALEKLDCYSTGIDRLDVSKNTALSYLYCSKTGIDSLDVSKNIALTSLSCYETEIDRLDVSKNTALISLHCYSTGISHLDVSKNTALTTLYCYKTGIDRLNVSKNTALTDLNCSDTGISGLDVSQNTALIWLNCMDTPLAYLNIGTNTTLNEILIPDSSNISLEVREDTFSITDAFPGIDIERVKDTRGADYDKTTGIVSGYNADTPVQYSYDCGTANGEKKTISVTLNLIRLPFEIEINDTNFPDAAFRRWLNENIDAADDNILTEKELKSITEMDMYDSGISNLKGIEYFTALAYLDIGSNSIEELDLSKNTALTTLSCEENADLGRLVLPENPVLTELNISQTGIDTFDITNLPALTSFSCYGDEFTSLNVTKNPALKTLDCSENNLSEIDVSKNPALEELNISDNKQIQSLDVSANPKLKILNCGYIPLGEINVSANTELEELSCSSNGLTELNLRANSKLKKLFCSLNSLTTIDLSNNKELAKFWCNNNKEALELNLESNRKLTELQCKKSGLTSLNLENAADLEKLDCRENQLSTLDISKNKKLTQLHCEKNQITDLDLSENSALTGLYCSSNQLTSLDLSGNPIKVPSLGSQKRTITVIGDSYTLSDMDSNLDPDRITSLTGATLEDGKLKGFTGKDVTYKYQTTKGSNSRTMSVTLSVIKKLEDSWISEPSISGWTYGDVPNTPAATAASGGEVSYTYSDSENGPFTQEIPSNAGKWYMKAAVAETESYVKLEKIVEFIISKADSSISITSNLDKDYDGNAVNSTPTVSKAGSTGEVTYNWEKKKNAAEWEGIAAAPTDAGTYRVMATVAADDNYKKASSIAKEFTISKADSTISVIDILDKDYDGSAVDNKPAVEKTGSTGAVTYTWEWKKNAVDWESIASAPTNAGIYRVTAAVAADGNYNEASSKAKEFIISKAENSWTSGLAITGWTYGQTANTPIAVAESGSVSYTYSDKEDGTYTRTVPTDAGTWYVKATVSETDNFKGMESSAVGFVIAKAAAPAITLPDNLSGEYKEDLANVALPDGWTWTDGTQKLTVSGTGYPARFTVDDKNYDYTGVAGYDSNGHYVECMLPVTVSTASNSWVTVPSIVGWTYNETASSPTGEAVYGDVVFTYSDSRTGTYSAEIPETVGTWYMKASVAATTEYTGLDTIVEFNILQAEPDYAVPTDLQAVYGQSLKDITLPAGFTWTDQKLNVGNAGTNEFTLTYTPADSNYKTVTDIKVTVTVAKAVNEQSAPLSLAGWTYGSTPSAASAGFRFGQPYFLYSDRLDGTYTDTVPAAAGTWYVKAVVDGTDNYESAESEAVSFVIEPKSVQKNSQIKVPEITADTKLDDLVIKDGDKVLIQGTDYDVTKIQDGNKVTVTITFKGNYTGTIVKTYTVNDKNKPSGKKDDPNRSVQTGDTTSAGLWAMLITAAAGTAALLKGKKRKEETEE